MKILTNACSYLLLEREMCCGFLMKDLDRRCCKLDWSSRRYFSSAVLSQGAKLSPLHSDLEYTSKVGAWNKFVERMVAAVAEGDQAYISLLVLNYRGFFSIQQVLDRVSNRYRNSCNLRNRDGGGQECLKNGRLPSRYRQK
ncbi:ral guanine nucleotide dissociation stimulator-like 1 isoform X3 [Tamandua tetradactyla]|uniref:ral guanine nucleotide dissociation stimulator-like 1 isoform X3 n=1 Tax=Tamandua tetradactyla TaxID=48850 RepID=UPI0040539C11